MKNDIHLVLELILTTGQMLLESGAETYRAEQAAEYIYESLGDGKINVFATVTMLVVGVYADGAHYTGIKQIKNRDINLSNLEKINNISRLVCQKEITAEQALLKLGMISSEKKKRLVVAPMAGLASGIFAIIIGGGAVEFFAAFFSCFIVHIIMLYSGNIIKMPFVISFIGGFIPTLISFLITTFSGIGNIEIITIASMLPFFPGVAMITAIRDSMNGDLVSGAARGNEAVFTAAGLAVGGVFLFFIR